MPQLNLADKVYVGANLASAVYLGSTKVWPSAPSVATMLTGTADTKLVVALGPQTSLAGQIPTGTAVGDLLVAFVCTQTALASGATFQENSGTWTLISPAYVLGSGKRPTAVWVKAIPDSATLSALTAPTFSSTSSGRWIVRINRIVNADLTSIADGASTAYASGTTSAALTTLSTTRASSLVLAVVHGVNTAAQLNPTWGAAPTGFTQAYTDNVVASGSNSNDSLYVATQSKTATGATGTTTVTVSNTQTSLDGFLVAIKTKSTSSPAPTIRSVTTANNSGATPYTTTVISFESPSTTRVGDLVLIIAGNNYYGTPEIASVTATGSPTITPIFNYSAGAAASGNATVAGFWYLANTAGAQTVVISGSPGTDSKSGTLYVLGGAHATAPVNDYATGGNTAAVASWVAPQVSPTIANCLVIAHVASNINFSATTVTTPGSLHEDINATPDTTYRYVEASTTVSATGPTGTYAFTPSRSVSYVGATIAIRPA